MYPEVPVSTITVGEFINDYNTGYAGIATDVRTETFEGKEYVVIDVDDCGELWYFPTTLIGVAR